MVRLNEDHFPLRPRIQSTVREMEIHYEEERLVVFIGTKMKHEAMNRRIAYVALSRARKALFLSYLEEEDDGKPLIASRFLTEFPDSLTTRKRIDSASAQQERITNTSQKRTRVISKKRKK